MTNLFFEKVGRGQHVGWKGAESLLFSIDAGFGFLDGIAGFLVLISMGDLVLTTTIWHDPTSLASCEFLG